VPVTREFRHALSGKEGRYSDQLAITWIIFPGYFFIVLNIMNANLIFPNKNFTY
jgi:hypothetical protein